MRKRTKARELVLQLLYQADVSGVTATDLADDFFAMNAADEDPSVKTFAAALSRDISSHLAELDGKISECATNWQIERMATVDRNVLRLATFELLFRPDIPPKVAINEAVDLAKKFGDLESGKFVNGILDKINKTKGAAAPEK